MKIRPPMTATQYSSSAVCLTLHQIARILWSKVTCLFKDSQLHYGKQGGQKTLSPTPLQKQERFHRLRTVPGYCRPSLPLRKEGSVFNHFDWKKKWGGGYVYLKRFTFSSFNLYRQGGRGGARSANLFHSQMISVLSSFRSYTCDPEAKL